MYKQNDRTPTNALDMQEIIKARKYREFQEANKDNYDPQELEKKAIEYAETFISKLGLDKKADQEERVQQQNNPRISRDQNQKTNQQLPSIKELQRRFSKQY